MMSNVAERVRIYLILDWFLELSARNILHLQYKIREIQHFDDTCLLESKNDKKDHPTSFCINIKTIC